MLSLGLSLTSVALRRGGPSVASLFASGAVGDYWSADDTSRLYQDTAGTSPITTSGQKVARRDWARGVISSRQATVDSQPTYTVAGGLHGLTYDGVNDWLTSAANLDLSGTDTLTVIYGVRKLSDAAAGMVAELSATTASNAGTFLLGAPITAAANYGWNARGDILPATYVSPSNFPAPHSAVLTGTCDISADATSLRVNGAVTNTDAADRGLGNFGSYPLYEGRRGGATIPFNGPIYAGLIIGRLLTPTELAQAEAWVASKSGVAL